MPGVNAQNIGISSKRKNRIYIGIPAFLIGGLALLIWLPSIMAGVHFPAIIGLIISITPYFLLIIGALMLVMLLRASKRWKKQLVITDNGFTDNAGFGFKEIEIAWDDVEGYKIIKKPRIGNFMILTIKNEDKYLGMISRKAVRDHLEKMKSHNGGYLGIALNWYEITEKEILEMFEKKITQNKAE